MAVKANVYSCKTDINENSISKTVSTPFGYEEAALDFLDSSLNPDNLKGKKIIVEVEDSKGNIREVVIITKKVYTFELLKNEN